MFRQSLLARRMCYYKRRNLKGLRRLLIAVSCIVLVLLIMAYAASRTIPLLEQEYESRLLHAVYRSLTGNMAAEVEGLDVFGTMVTVLQDDTGHIQRVDVDKVKAERFCEALSRRVEQNLAASLAGSDELHFRLGMVLGGSTFAGVGPDIVVRAGTTDRVEAELQPVLEAAEKNSTALVLMLQVRAQVRYHILFSDDKKTVEVRVPLTESLLNTGNTGK